MNSRFPKKQDTSEKLKAKQYGAASLNCILVAVIMTVVRLIWGSVMLGSGADKISSYIIKPPKISSVNWDNYLSGGALES